METDLILVGGNVEKNDEECSSRDEQHHRPTDSSHIVLPKNVSNQHQAQFTVFCRKKRDAIAQENPSWSTTDIDAHLWQQWSQLDDETRSRFIPMGSDFTYLSRMMQNVDVGGGESGVVKQTTTLGKMNGFSGEAPGTRIVVSSHQKSSFFSNLICALVWFYVKVIYCNCFMLIFWTIEFCCFRVQRI